MNRNKILNTILPSYEAREIAEDCGYTSEQEGAEFYFNEVYYEGEWHIGDLPKYKRFVKEIEGGDLYYDYGDDYYFLVQTEKMKKNKKQVIKLTEFDLHNIIKESVKKVLKETRLDYDEDNFSGKYTQFKDDGINPDEYLDDPYNEPCNFEDEDWIDGDKNMENDYSWNYFNHKSIAPGVGGYYKVNKFGVQKDIDDAHIIRNRKKNWTKKELNNRNRMMSKWVKGERNLDDVDDAWYGIH